MIGQGTEDVEHPPLVDERFQKRLDILVPLFFGQCFYPWLG
jgi:hypothetical protein